MTDPTRTSAESGAPEARRIYEQALQRIVENAREQPVPMDPIAFNYAQWAIDALEEVGWLEGADA